ncbi:hypothetical protein DFP79_1575 [Marinomonas balearica]|uniref:Uncharacterized protein n=1 Tax=Marinomonas balearica TaxID=491947 RepID=A0A4R6M949_9GAMM|nr:hypothetical protein DFP79_1575 [Marinomonas balearica]
MKKTISLAASALIAHSAFTATVRKGEVQC